MEGLVQRARDGGSAKAYDSTSQIIRRLLSSRELGRQTEYFDRGLEGLNLKDLPEYQAAVDAMNAYAEAAVSRYVMFQNQQESVEVK